MRRVRAIICVVNNADGTVSPMCYIGHLNDNECASMRRHFSAMSALDGAVGCDVFEAAVPIEVHDWFCDTVDYGAVFIPTPEHSKGES